MKTALLPTMDVAFLVMKEAWGMCELTEIALARIDYFSECLNQLTNQLGLWVLSPLHRGEPVLCVLKELLIHFFSFDTQHKGS